MIYEKLSSRKKRHSVASNVQVNACLCGCVLGSVSPAVGLGLELILMGVFFRGPIWLSPRPPLEGKALRGMETPCLQCSFPLPVSQQPRVLALTELQHLTVTRPCSCRAAGKRLLVLCNSCTALSGLQQTVPCLKLDSQMSTPAINRNKFDPPPVYFTYICELFPWLLGLGLSVSDGWIDYYCYFGALDRTIFAVLCALYSYAPYMEIHNLWGRGFPYGKVKVWILAHQWKAGCDVLIPIEIKGGK